MTRTTKQHEEWLRQRFVVARRIVAGEFGGYALSESVLKSTLDVSLKTHQGDIKRAKIYATFDDWRPAKTGPKPGNRRISTRVLRIIEEETYKRASQKLNVRKLSRDLVYDIENLGIPVREQPSQSTITRIINETRAADPAHFASEQFGRLGRRRHMLQKGSIEATRPLEIVVIDHTPGDQRNFSLHDEQVIIRPTLTTATDLFTGACLAAFFSFFPPSRETVAMAMAMIAVDKTDMLRRYFVPGEWECAGLPETVMVDGAAEFDNATFQWSCDRYGIVLEVGLPGLPEARAKHERSFRTLNQDIHHWPGTTLSNPQELKAHGGERDVETTLEEAQRQLLLAVMEFNNETYSGIEPPRIFKWRDYEKSHPLRRQQTLDPRRTFIDFLPHKFGRLLTVGIKFENCVYRSSDLAKPMMEGVKQVRFHWDPRDTSEIYVSIADGPYLTIPRATPRNAPNGLYELRRFNRGRRVKAEEAKDSALLAQIRAAKKADPYGFARFLLERGDAEERQTASKFVGLQGVGPLGLVSAIDVEPIASQVETPTSTVSTHLSVEDLPTEPDSLDVPDFASRLK